MRLRLTTSSALLTVPAPPGSTTSCTVRDRRRGDIPQAQGPGHSLDHRIDHQHRPRQSLEMAAVPPQTPQVLLMPRHVAVLGKSPRARLPGTAGAARSSCTGTPSATPAPVPSSGFSVSPTGADVSPIGSVVSRPGGFVPLRFSARYAFRHTLPQRCVPCHGSAWHFEQRVGSVTAPPASRARSPRGTPRCDRTSRRRETHS